MATKEPKTPKVHPAEAVSAPTPPTPDPNNNNALAITSMVLGVVSLTGPGLLLGIPAIILGAMALKRKQGERGLSITGLVTGIVSTVISLIVLFFMIIGFIWIINHPEQQQRYPRQSSPSRDMRFEDSQQF